MKKNIASHPSEIVWFALEKQRNGDTYGREEGKTTTQKTF